MRPNCPSQQLNGPRDEPVVLHRPGLRRPRPDRQPHPIKLTLPAPPARARTRLEAEPLGAGLVDRRHRLGLRAGPGLKPRSRRRGRCRCCGGRADEKEEFVQGGEWEKRGRGSVEVGELRERVEVQVVFAGGWSAVVLQGERAGWDRDEPGEGEGGEGYRGGVFGLLEEVV